MMLWKCCTQYANKFGKLTRGENWSVFIPLPKKANAKECSNYHTTTLISHASKVIFKIQKARLQQYVNYELPDVQAGFRKDRESRSNCQHWWIIEQARELQKSIYFCFIDYTKAFDCVYNNKLWKILKVTGIPFHITCLLRKLYVGQEATVRTRHRTTDCFQLGKENVRAVYCHSAYLTSIKITSCKMLCTSWNQDCQEKYQ